MKEENPDIPLGKHSQYPKEFDPNLLFAIPRMQARASLGIKPGIEQLPFVGYDEWTLYELCWLNSERSPQVAIGLLKIPADSESIVESKSLKLYANGLYYKRFDSSDELVNQVTSDLNQLLNTQVQFSLLELTALWPNQPHGQYQSIDQYQIQIADLPDKNLLAAKTSPESDLNYKTMRFRSLCPVTGQPDWAGVYIRICGVDIEAEALAQYLAGYSEHQGFHENCVERIYLELHNQLMPYGLSALSVAARYTRRGGIDINPIRASSMDMLDMPARELRQ